MSKQQLQQVQHSWILKPEKLEEFVKYVDDEQLQNKFLEVKKIRKNKKTGSQI